MSDFLSQSAEYLPILLQGAWLTVAVTVLSLALATLLGLLWALLRTSGVAALAAPTRVLVEFVRGIPILVILFYLYFVMPEIGLDLTAFQAGVIGLALTYSCYIGETFRAGIRFRAVFKVRF